MVDEPSVIMSEVEIRWAPGKVMMGPFILPNVYWTPEQAEKIAEYLVLAANSARNMKKDEHDANGDTVKSKA